MFFEDLIKKVEAFSAIDENFLMIEAFQRSDVRVFTVDLIKFNQLFKGVDGKGEKLEDIGGEYSPFTINIKKDLGLPFDRVTLFQFGDFYESIIAIRPFRTDEVITIEANFIKDGTDLRRRWGPNLIFLNQDSTVKLCVYLLPIFKEIILNVWCNA